MTQSTCTRNGALRTSRAMAAALFCIFFGVSHVAPTFAAPDFPPLDEILPPQIPGDGASRALVAPNDDPWVTPCEKSGLTRTPRYDETMDWLRRFITSGWARALSQACPMTTHRLSPRCKRHGNLSLPPEPIHISRIDRRLVY